MGVDFGVIWAADFDNVIRFYIGRLAVGQRTPTARRHTKIQKRRQMYRYGYRFWGYWLLISIMLLDDTSAAPPAGQGSPVVTAKF